ncbi:hypothetical protein [Streptosporangium minutum]|uniref:hypothetical protein n=1 Tax=Streptosporangium minutum TaxID=569862 RepID=UPI001A99E387|nr:hypothetical protein [Streptosporangium minutum]
MTTVRPYRPDDRAALRDRGVPAVHLGMVTVDTPARAFYNRLGFHEIPIAGPGPVTCPGRRTDRTAPPTAAA